MFNFDQAITEWRRQMTAGGIKTPAILDELESHLREEVEQQMQSGANAERAFERAVKKIGTAEALRNEFEKSVGRSALEKLMVATAFLFIAFGVFLSVVTIVFCYLTTGERLIAFVGLGFALTITCGWCAAVPRLPVIRDKQKRRLAEVGCLLLGFGLSTLFAQTVVHHSQGGLDRILPPIAFWCLLPVTLGVGIAGGLEKVARGIRKSASA